MSVIGTYIVSALAGSSLMYIGSLIDNHERKNINRTFYGSCVIVIGYGICWNGPVSHVIKLRTLNSSKIKNIF